MARHWKAVHHQEGFVPRQEHTHCVEAFDDAVAFLQEALRQAAEQYRVRDADLLSHDRVRVRNIAEAIEDELWIVADRYGPWPKAPKEEKAHG